MHGGSFAQPVRRGDTVVRSPGAGSVNVHALLRHFEQKGFTLAPRFIGMTADGAREVLSFIDGETAYPPLSTAVRDDETLVNVAAAIRAMHDAAADFTPPEPGTWCSPESSAPVTVDCIGHRDLGPWNFIFDGTDVVGIIDWDFAGPSSRAWDLAYAVHQFVPLHPADDLAPWGWNTEPDRSARLRMFADAYGEDVTAAELVDLAIVRLTSIAAHMESHIRVRNPVYEKHWQEDHPTGYRKAAQFLIGERARLLA